MTDSNATDELRHLLDDRGVSCQTHYLHTSWCVGSKLYEALDNLDGTLTVGNLTPEQAIAATLGKEPRDKTEEWLLNACNQATQDYVAQLEQERDELKSKLEAATLGSNHDEIYNAGFDNGVKAALQQLEGIMNDKWSSSLTKVENIEDWIAEQWRGYES